MKTILDRINESCIDESRTRSNEMEKYAKSWITQCTKGEEYSDVLHAIINGLEAGAKDNKKYLKDDQEQADVKVLLDILTHLSLSVPRKKGIDDEWSDEWVSRHLL